MARQRLPRAVFFDRDGTLNVDTGYLHRPTEFQWTDEAPLAVRYVNDSGYLAIVVTNQSGVARGYFGEEQVNRLHLYMNAQLAAFGAHVDAFYYCPHLPGGAVERYAVDCDCRKPKPGLILKAIADFRIAKTGSLLIGDGDRDLECARRAGVKAVRYTGGSLLELVKAVLPPQQL